jgi:O-antigen ligase
MNLADEPQPASRRGKWLTWAAAALLFLSLMIGGGGAQAPLLNAVLQAGGGLLLCAVVAEHVTGVRVPAAATVPVLFLVALLLLVVAQLVPMPPSLWNALPGREAARAAYALTGDPGRWRPLSLDPEATRRFACSLLLPAGLFVATLRAGRGGFAFMTAVMIAGALVSALMAGVQMALGLPDDLFPFGRPGGGVPTGVFANPNHQAQMMLAALVLSGLAIRQAVPSSRAGRPRFHIAWLLLPVFAASAAATQSRAAIILLVPAFAAATLLALNVRGLTRIFGLSAAVLLLFGLAVGLTTRGLDGVMQLQTELSAGGRITNFPDILFTLEQFWPWGSGLGTFVPVFMANENLDLLTDAYLNHAHNDLLEVLIEGGLAAAVLLLAALLAFAVRLWRLATLRRTDETQVALAGLTILVLALVHSLVDYPLRMHALAAVAAVALAFFVSPGEGQRRVAEPPRGRVLVRSSWAVLLLVGAVLGIQAIRIGLGQAAVRGKNASLAAAVRPENGWGLALLSERQLAQRQAALAAQTARAAIQRTPLAVVALRTLARAEEKLHRHSASEQAWQAASLLGWRDKQVQVWAAVRALSNGQADVFAMRADALLRTGDPDELMTRFIREAAVQPQVRKALVARLVTQPPWRIRFFRAERPPTGRALQGVVDVLMGLGATNAPPSREELRDAIAGLISARRYLEAVQIDRRFVRRAADAGSLLEDGGFELTATDYQSRATPFDWAIDARSAAVDSTGEGRRIALFATGSPDPALRRFVGLPAGRYRLAFAISGPPDSGSSLRFAAACAASAVVLGESPQQPLVDGEWQSRGFDFAVPARCGLVELTVRRTQPGSADALIDNVRLIGV